MATAINSFKPLRDLSFERILWHPWAGVVGRLLIGGVFIYAGVGKIAYPADFARSIYAYRVLHVEVVNLAALSMPWIEVLAGGLLILGLGRRSAGAVITGLMGLFILAGGLALLRGLNVECGCFISGSSTLGPAVMLRDLALFGVALYAAVHPSDHLTVDGWCDRRAPPG